ncbi:MAG: DUF86 domain-containing protein [Fimbriimonadaceae bacterium]|nr:DUF86 domain-containing protein [Fimbriimonadaceae bacterium]
MSLEILLDKLESIERCLANIALYSNAPALEGYPHAWEDAIQTNLQRACELTIDVANLLVQARDLGVSRTAAGAFRLLESAGWISSELAEEMSRMVRFRNVLAHRYKSLDPSAYERAKSLGIERIREFAMLALQLHPENAPNPPEPTSD